MPSNARPVDFIYVGGPRCGSTWLSAVLADHPKVFVPPSKEIHFFNDRMPYDFEYRYPRGMDFYRSFFTAAAPGQQVGDISPFYFLDPNAAHRIVGHLPDIRIVAMLRDPVDMLYSLYLLLRRREKRAATFEEELALRPQLIDLCRYDRLLAPYFDLLPGERLLVMLNEDIRLEPERSVREIYSFLGVDETFSPPSLSDEFNVATDEIASWRARSRGYAIRALNKPMLREVKNVLVKRGMKDITHYGRQDKARRSRYEGPLDSTRRWLADWLRDDLRRLAERLGRDLSIWPTYALAGVDGRSSAEAAKGRVSSIP